MKNFQLPKFRIGDEVWNASSDYVATQIQCPDCKGEKVWWIMTPAGEEFETHCRTCWHGYDGCYGTISEYDYVPKVRRMTIGMVNTRQSDLQAEIQYMCIETGIGFGSLWDEDCLFETETEACIYAETQAEIKRGRNEESITQENKRQREKDHLIMEPNPRKVLEDEVNRLKEQVKTLKRKPLKSKVKKTLEELV